MSVSKHIIPQQYRVTKADRIRANGHKPCVVWLTGLSGSGKSTLANAVEQKLFEKGIHTYVLDGDNIRHGLNSNVDFSPEGRKENIRRIGEAAKLFVDAGMVVLTAFISPYRADRDHVRSILGEDEFVEVFVNCPLEVCEARDVKGLYQKARAGEIPDFTGISSPFEEPLHPEITVRTNDLSIEESADIINDYILKLITIQK
jgi:adenylylsulfate kinase